LEMLTREESLLDLLAEEDRVLQGLIRSIERK